MFQDEKTTELDLNKPLQQARWTENHYTARVDRRSPAATVPQIPTAIEPKHLPWLVKLAAAVTILILSLWLF